MTKEGGYAQVPSVSNQCAARRVVSMACRSRVSLSQPRESLFDALEDPLFRFVTAQMPPQAEQTATASGGRIKMLLNWLKLIVLLFSPPSQSIGPHDI